MRTVKIWSDHASEGQLREIVNILDEGGIIIYPTDTVYAFGCDALNSRAIESICRLKGINPQKIISLLSAPLSLRLQNMPA